MLKYGVSGLVGFRNAKTRRIWIDRIPKCSNTAYHELFRGSGRAARHNKVIQQLYAFNAVFYCFVHIFRQTIEPLICTPPRPCLLAQELDQLDSVLNDRRQPRWLSVGNQSDLQNQSEFSRELYEVYRPIWSFFLKLTHYELT